MTGMLISPEFYGETRKVSDDGQKCTEIRFPTTENCENQVRNPFPLVHLVFTGHCCHLEPYLKW